MWEPRLDPQSEKGHSGKTGEIQIRSIDWLLLALDQG